MSIFAKKDTKSKSGKVSGNVSGGKSKSHLALAEENLYDCIRPEKG